VIPWEFGGFSVESCFDRLCMAQKLIEENGKVSGRIHRFMITAEK